MAGNQKQGSSSGNRRDSQGRAQGRSSQSNSPDDTEDSVTASQSHAPRQQPAPVRQDLQNRESLAAGVRSVLNNFQDLELQNLLLRRYWEVDERSRPEMTRVVEMTVNLLRVAGPRLTLREAVILLLNAGLNQALAALQYIRHREPRLEREVATVLHPPPPPQASQVKQTLDNDDELPLPDGVRVIEIDPWETGTKVRAVYHHEIRKYLIERDIRRYGKYHYKRNKGKVFEDQTSPHPDQLNWRFDKRERLPDILLQYKKGNHENPDYKVEDMYWRGHVVIDIDRNPLLDYRNIPSALAGNVEGGLMEAIERTDGRVRHQDLAARQYVRNPLEYPTLKHLKNRDNKLAQQTRRFRERNCCITWWNKRSGSDAFLSYIDNLLPQEMKDKNTTRGFRKLSKLEIAEVKAVNLGKFESRSGSKDKAKTAAYLAEEARKLQKLRHIANRRNALEEPQLDSEDEAETEEVTESEEEIEESEPETPRDPDSRHEYPTSTVEEQELHDSFMPTVLHFLDLTGELPLITTWSGSSYLQIHWAMQMQLDAIRARRGEDSSVILVGLGRWSGGIGNWRTASLTIDFLNAGWD